MKSPRVVPGDDLDTDLGEEYYKGKRELEQQYAEQIINVIRSALDQQRIKGRHPVRRDAHAFDTGCVKALFRVDKDLDRELRHGVFVPGREYEAWIRFSNGNSEPRPRWWPDARGMAIKLMGVAGCKLLDDEKETQDFVLISRPAFFVDDLERYKRTLEFFLKGDFISQYILSPLCLRGREIGLALKVNLFLISNPLFQQYWSMTPYRLGSAPGRRLAVKYTAVPRLRDNGVFSPLRKYLSFLVYGATLKDQVQDVLKRSEMWFDFYIQQGVDDRTPIEDSKTEWKESISPPKHVAKVIIPAQDMRSSARDWFCENLSFNPWHSLSEHKPLGVVNRVRKAVYLSISEYRHQLNYIPKQEPSTQSTVESR